MFSSLIQNNQLKVHSIRTLLFCEYDVGEVRGAHTGSEFSA